MNDQLQQQPEPIGCPFCGKGAMLWQEQQKQGEDNMRTLFRVGCPMCRVSMTEPGPWSQRNLEDHPANEVAVAVLMLRWNLRTAVMPPMFPQPPKEMSNSDNPDNPETKILN